MTDLVKVLLLIMASFLPQNKPFNI